MQYTPPSAPPDPIVMNTYSRGSLAETFRQARVDNFAAGAWPSANLAIFVPFGVHNPFNVVKILSHNGPASGNIDVGIYDTAGNRLVSSGSTAQSGSVAQEFDVTDTIIPAGRGYMAIALDNGVGQVNQVNNFSDIATYGFIQIRELASAFPLPSSVSSWVLTTRRFIPIMGFTRRTVV